MTRQQKTPKQRAEETLAVAQRRCDRLTRDANRLRTELDNVENDLADAITRRDYAKADPALQGSTTSQSTSNQSGDPA